MIEFTDQCLVILSNINTLLQNNPTDFSFRCMLTPNFCLKLVSLKYLMSTFCLHVCNKFLKHTQIRFIHLCSSISVQKVLKVLLKSWHYVDWMCNFWNKTFILVAVWVKMYKFIHIFCNAFLCFGKTFKIAKCHTQT